MKLRHQVWVDFMDMDDDGRVWARPADARPGLLLEIGRHVVIGDDDADPMVARIVAVDSSGNVELQVLPGPIETRADHLTPPWDADAGHHRR